MSIELLKNYGGHTEFGHTGKPLNAVGEYRGANPLGVACQGVHESHVAAIAGLEAAASLHPNHVPYRVGRKISVRRVATNKPPIIASAMGPQNRVGRLEMSHCQKLPTSEPKAITTTSAMRALIMAAMTISR